MLWCCVIDFWCSIGTQCLDSQRWRGAKQLAVWDLKFSQWHRWRWTHYIPSELLRDAASCSKRVGSSHMVCFTLPVTRFQTRICGWSILLFFICAHQQSVGFYLRFPWFIRQVCFWFALKKTEINQYQYFSLNLKFDFKSTTLWHGNNIQYIRLNRNKFM